MSIVETALSKAKSTPAPDDRRRDRPAPLRVSGERAAAGESMPSVAPAPARVPARARITINFDSLRERGMLPPPELSQRYSDQFRRVKWPLLAAATGNGAPRVDRGNLILITSAVPGEGKSFLSLNLALNTAAGDTRVLLVDADPAKSRLSRLCGVHQEPGFVDLVRSADMTLADVVLDTNVAGLQLLPAGEASLLTPELFSSRRAEQILAELADHDPNQIVLVDSAPLLAANDAQVLARHMGQIVMVVRGDDTPQSAVIEAVNLLDRGRPIRCVINQVRAGLFGERYGHYYYKYDNVQD